jgi:hypothetical protein
VKTIIAILIVSSAIVTTPVYANWFDGALQYGGNHKKLLGSALTPTPDDLRAVGDSGNGVGKNYDFDEKSGHWREIRSTDGAKETAQGTPGDQSAAAAKSGSDARAGN